MPTAITIDQFEGPLGLLLELVERNQMPVTNIAVATITSQYLERVQQMTNLPAEDLSEFLQLGSRLAYIKSLALLPTIAPDEQADELRQLGRELADYQRYQAAARQLAEAASRPTAIRPVAQRLAVTDVPLAPINLGQLAELFQAALRRAAPVRPIASLSAQLSQASVMTGLKQRLAQGAFQLTELLDELHNRLEIVVTFSALLEIIRRREARVTQTGLFGSIVVEPAS